MTEVLIVVILVCGLSMSYAIHKRLVSPISLFCSSWLLVLGVHFSNIMDYYPLTEHTLNCTLLMTVSFLVGALIAQHRLGKLRGNQVVRDVTIELYRRYVVVLGVYLALGILGFALYLAIGEKSYDAMADYNRMSRSGETLYRPVREFIFSVSFPCMITTALVSMTLFARLRYHARGLSMADTTVVRGVSRNLAFLATVSCICLILFDLFSLGRIFVVIVAALLFAAFFCTTDLSKYSKRPLAMSAIALSIFVFLIKLVTERRQIASGSDVWYSVLNYFTGPLAYFNQVSETSQYFALGRMTFGAFESFFLRPFDFVPFVRDFIPPVSELLAERQITVNIGPGSRYNAFGTIMLDGYYDAGVYGVMFLACIVGYVSTHYFIKSQVLSSPRTLCLGTLSAVWVLWSPLSWAGGFSSIGVAVFWVFIADFLASVKLRRVVRRGV